MKDDNLWEQYIKDVWHIFPLYTFYEVNFQKLPWQMADRMFIFSTISIKDIEIQHVKTTKFFNIYEVYPTTINSPIGYIFRTRNFDEKLMKLYYSTHGISVCTDSMTFKETMRLDKDVIYDKAELSITSYGNDAEVISDIAKVMGI